MAKKETFLMVSLEEDKAKKLAQVLSNDTSRKILDHLSNKKATETELSKELSLPISTVHYNLKALVESRLVEAGEFHYSDKGKEVLHYSLANKYVIIAPKAVSEGLKDKLKSILPAIAAIGVIALVLQYAQNLFGSVSSIGSSSLMKAAPVAERAMLESAPAAADMAAQETFAMAPQAASSQPIGLWFAIGAVLCLMIYLLIDHLVKKYR